MTTPAEYLAQVDALRRALADEQTRQILTRFADDKAAYYRDEAIAEALRPEPQIIRVVRNAAKMEEWRVLMSDLDYLTKV